MNELVPVARPLPVRAVRRVSIPRRRGCTLLAGIALAALALAGLAVTAAFAVMR